MLGGYVIQGVELDYDAMHSVYQEYRIQTLADFIYDNYAPDPTLARMLAEKALDIKDDKFADAQGNLEAICIAEAFKDMLSPQLYEVMKPILGGE